MRRFVVVSSLVIAVAVTVSAIAYSQGMMTKQKSTTVTGSLIDTKCYSMDARNKGMDHITPMGEMKGCGALCARLGIPVATGRLLQHAPSIGRIGRMAVNRGLRGSRFGKDVLMGLVDAARQRGDTEVLLHAQCSAEGFYTRLGFVARGAVFEEAGIQHIEMVLPLV